MNSCQKYFSICLLAVLTQAAFAQNAPILGTAANFAALGGAGVTCTSPIPPLPAVTVTGDVGSLLTAPSSVTGFPNFTPGANPCSINGSIHVGDPVAVQAYNDFVGAYNQIAALNCPADPAFNLSGNLGGRTLSPGFYCISGVGLLSGLIPLTLNGGANDTWLFKAASSLTPIGGSVVMAGGAQACNVYWQTGTAVSLDATQFLGTILAGTAISFTGVGSSLTGRALAKTESVTMTGASITGCGAQPGPGPNPKPCSDRVTGGGEIKIGQKGKATFAVTAGIRKGEFQGELTYTDHSTGMKVKGTGVTAYVVVDAVTRRIEGTARINGVAGTYTVVVSDNGEPGRNDTFAITLSTGYSASGKLAGGNIQLHKQHCDQGDDEDDDDDDDDGDGHGDGDHGDKGKKGD